MILPVLRFSAALILAAAVGCGDDGTVEPHTGTVEIITTTTGEAGADYTVLMDGASPRTVSPNGTLEIPAVPVGSYIVQLAVPTSCSIEGDNPRTVNVTTNATITVTFAVTCGAG